MQETGPEDGEKRSQTCRSKLLHFRTLLVAIGVVVVAGLALVIYFTAFDDEEGSGNLPRRLRKLEFDDYLLNKFGAPSFSSNASWISDSELVYRNAEEDLAIMQETGPEDGEKRSQTCRSKLLHFRTLLVAIGVVVVAGLALVIYFTAFDDEEGSGNLPRRLRKLEFDDYLLNKFGAPSFSSNASWISDSELVYRNAEEDLIYRHSFNARYSIYDIERGNVTNVTLNASTIPPDSPVYFSLAKWAPTEDRLVLVFRNDLYYRPDPREDRTFRVTSNGEPDAIFNGIADWVYEEEVFGDSSAVWWSGDSSKFAYLSFDDRRVPVMEYAVYRPYSVDNQYPTTVKLHYPKVGTENPVVALWMVDVESSQSNPHSIMKSTILLSSVSENEEYYVTGISWSGGSHLAVNLLNRHQNYSITDLCSRLENSTWVCSDALTRENNEGWFEIPAPTFPSSLDSSAYLIVLPDEGWKRLFKVSSSSLSEPLTPVGFEVIEVYTWDAENNHIYIRGTYGNASSERGVYRIEEDTLNMTCLSCSSPDEDCSFASAYFSQNTSYYALQCATPRTVANRVTIKETESGKVVKEWFSNSDLVENLNTLNLPVERNLEVEVAEGFKAKVRLFLPPDLDESGSTKYPMIVFTYAGPNSKLIVDGWRGVDWGTYLSGAEGIIYAMIDGRGSGFRGERLLYQLYRRLGTVEVQDQINVTRTLVRDLGYIDEKRVGIWGWSYGGFTTAMALANDTEGVFKCGISVAPVTSWLYYGIHLLNTSYPDENHALGGVRRHVYHSMLEFWKVCFDLA
ncbi:unnamed protein product [Darwinula stevensoni]|uniref:Uncharacterized protein n=1 Tax=Darwinula stevensoni TaxID=69355 RepID=A0A7R8XEJ0_9CRUS|nr:unnamed protein product [Darwinula stevensoni]CAG0895799.1 unnamed protein product [Darwinula stevensoni]